MRKWLRLETLTALLLAGAVAFVLTPNDHKAMWMFWMLMGGLFVAAAWLVVLVFRGPSEGPSETPSGLTEVKMHAAMLAHFGVDPADDDAIDRLFSEQRAEVDAWFEKNRPEFFRRAGYDE